MQRATASYYAAEVISDGKNLLSPLSLVKNLLTPCQHDLGKILIM